MVCCALCVRSACSLTCCTCMLTVMIMSYMTSKNVMPSKNMPCQHCRPGYVQTVAYCARYQLHQWHTILGINYTNNQWHTMLGTNYTSTPLWLIWLLSSSPCRSCCIVSCLRHSPANWNTVIMSTVPKLLRNSMHL